MSTYNEYGQLVNDDGSTQTTTPGQGTAAPVPAQTPAQPVRAPKPTTPAPVGYRWVYVPGTNSWEMQGASASETMDQQLAAASKPPPTPVVPYGTQGASTTLNQPPATPDDYSGGRGYSSPNAVNSAGPTPAAAPAPQGGVIGYDPGYAKVDRTAYDQAATGYDRAVSTFQSELDRLSGVDPFGNQAFLRKATDRAAGQAQGLAAGGLSTATARAGNMRQAQGVQASLAAQGIEQQGIQRNADEVQAGQLRLNAAGGLANTLGAKATNEIELAKLDTQTGMANMDAYLKKYGVDAQLKQQDIENLRGVNVELQKLGEQASEADVQALLQKYGIDENTKAALKQIAQSGKFTTKDVVGGIFGIGAGVAQGVATKSDRRSKFDVRDPDLRDLEDFLGRTKGKLYRYKEPKAPGQRTGLNYGPMAQDLQKSKIGRTVVVEGKDGLYVDTGRLALADHAALAELAREVKALKSGR